MPLPATHLQPVQAAVKMVTAPDLSLRGRFAPVAITGRHLQSIQGVDKTHGPIASVAALSERHWQSQIWRHSWRTYNALKFVIARPQRGRGNLGKAVTISPMAFPRSSDPAGYCEIATSAFGLLAMTHQVVLWCIGALARLNIPLPGAQKSAAGRLPGGCL